MQTQIMNIVDLNDDNLLDIICCTVKSSSPKNVLWIANISLVCKKFHCLTKHCRVWRELSKTWFLEKHVKQSRIEFISGVMEYNFPDELSVYDFDIEEKPLHSMFIYLLRIRRGIFGFTHNKEGQWLLDPYYEILAKNICNLSEFNMNEVRNYDPYVVACSENHDKKIYIKALEVSKRTAAPSNLTYQDFDEFDKIMPKGHLSEKLIYFDNPATIFAPIQYIYEYADIDLLFNLLEKHNFNGFLESSVDWKLRLKCIITLIPLEIVMILRKLNNILYREIENIIEVIRGIIK